MPDPVVSAVCDLLAQNPLGTTTDRICAKLGKSAQQLGDILEELKESGRVLGFAGTWLLEDQYQSIAQIIISSLKELHEGSPTSNGFPVSQILKAADLHWEPKPANRLFSRMESDGLVRITDELIGLATVPYRLSDRQQSLLNRVSECLASYDLNTPPPSVLSREMGMPYQAVEEILKLGMAAGVILQLDENVFYTHDQLNKIEARLRAWAGSRSFTPNEARDAMESTRKYIHPLLAYLDAMGATVKNGPNRTFKL